MELVTSNFPRMKNFNLRFASGRFLIQFGSLNYSTIESDTAFDAVQKK